MYYLRVYYGVNAQHAHTYQHHRFLQKFQSHLQGVKQYSYRTGFMDTQLAAVMGEY